VSVRVCQRCGTSAPADFVICPKCHALFFADQLARLHAEATALETNGDFLGALEKLRAMEPMLPRGSVQATQLAQRITTLEPKAGQQPRQKKSNQSGLFAGLGAALIALLTKGKFLFLGLTKLPTLLSFFVSAALWRDSSAGAGLALVVLGSIYVHEMGHTWAFRRYGIAVSAPMFVPGFGAFVRGSHYPKSPEAAGDVALSGPVWGAVSGIITLGLGLGLDQPWLIGAAVLIAEVNLFNLFPVWQLDGSRAVATLSKNQVVLLAFLGLAGGAIASSPMALLAGTGLLVRRFVRAPEGPGNTRTFVVFLVSFVVLLALRFAAQHAMPA
jgi:Zn-dependent protease